MSFRQDLLDVTLDSLHGKSVALQRLLQQTYLNLSNLCHKSMA